MTKRRDDIENMMRPGGSPLHISSGDLGHKRATGWADMSTAPQHEEVLLLCGAHRIVGRWRQNYTSHALDSTDLRLVSGGLRVVGYANSRNGQWVTTHHDSADGRLPCEPTGWAAIPAIPSNPK